MADVRILYTEEAVGYNHPTKADVINRPILVSHDASGNHSTVDFPCLSINMGGTDCALSSNAQVALTFSTAGGVLFNTGPYELSATGIKCPSVGKYLFNASAEVHLAASAIAFYAGITRNSSFIAQGPMVSNWAAGTWGAPISAVIICNSTTDVFSMTITQNGGTAHVNGGSSQTWLTINRVGK